MTLTQVAGVHDAPVLDLDERTQLVGLAETVARAEIVETIDPIRRRFVVVGDPELERDLRWAGDRLRWDPRDGDHRRFEALQDHRDLVSGWRTRGYATGHAAASRR